MSGAGESVHASCVCLEGAGLLLMGPSGAGKSDLALRLIDRGARLVADDRVRLEARGAGLWAWAPEPLKGLLEVRGLGLLTLEALAGVELRAAIHLGPPKARLPEADIWAWGGVSLPAWHIAPFEASAGAKLAALARTLTGELPLDPPPGSVESSC